MHPLRGIHVPLITPFTAGDAVDTDALRRLAHEVLDDGAAGLVALGTTAEASTLDEKERATVVGICRAVARERDVPLIVGAGSNNTATTAGTVAELSDVSAALVTVPYFTRPTEAGVLAHFRQVAERGAVPIIAYHVPHRTGRTLSVETLLAIADIPGVIGIKYAVDAVDGDTLRFLHAVPDDVAVLAGDDPTAPLLLGAGAGGGILASAHLCARQFATLSQVPELIGLAAALFAEPNPAVLKAVLHHQGRIATAAVRLLLLAASAQSLATALARLELVTHG